MRQKHYIFFSLLFVTLTSFSQSPFFKNYTLPQPFQKTDIQIIYQGESGYIWLGTEEGLFRFDGTDFQLFIRKDSLENNQVTAIFEDFQNRLWAGYSDGQIFYIDNGELQQWMPEEGLPKVPITGFAEDKNATFWFATYGEGLYAFHQQRLYNFNTDDGLLSNDIYCIQKSPNQEIWLGTDAGISICTFENQQKNIKNLTKADGLPDEIIYTILPNGIGGFWVGMYDKGIAFVNHSADKIVHLTPDWRHGSIKAMAHLKHLELWLGTEREGVFRYKFDQKKVEPISTASPLLGQFRIYDLHKDKEGNIWIASNQKGLYVSNRQIEFLSTPFKNIQTILTTSTKTLWIGTDEGLYSYSDTTTSNPYFTVYFKDLHLNVISLYEDDQQNIWIGTFGAGIYILKPDDSSFRHIDQQEGLPNGSILSLDGFGGTTYLATLGGLTELKFNGDILANPPLAFKNFGKKDGLSSNYIYKIFIDSKKKTWLATDGNGISIYDQGGFTNMEYALIKKDDSVYDSIPLKTVYSIVEDTSGNIWFSTNQNGIFKFNQGDFKQLALKEGIQDLSITGLVSNKKNEILVVHPNGMDVLNPMTNQLIYYDESVGIKNIDPHLNAFSANENGNIWVAGQAQLIRFTPLKELLQSHPKTVFKDIIVHLESTDFQQVNCFEYHQNDFIFKYAGLWFTAPEKIKFRYQLVGLDQDWIYSNDAQATYSNLPPGQYVFKVAAGENNRFNKEQTIAYEFEVLAPFWQRSWFVLLAICVLTGLVYWLIKFREQRLSRLNLIEKEKIESQFQALKSQINPHFLFNSFNTLAAITEVNPVAAIEYIEKFSDFYRNMLQYRDKVTIPLEEELMIVNNYSYLLEKRFGKNLIIDIPIAKKEVYVAPLALQVLVENAVKHNIISKNRPLKIQIHQRDGYLEVRNNLQKKLTTEKSTSFGLQSLVKQYALLSKKAVKIDKTATYFSVAIPLIQPSKLLR